MGQEQNINFLRLKLHNERDFICGYFNISKKQVRFMFSDLLQKPESQCHISSLNYEEICSCFDFIRHLTLGARNGEGRRLPKTITKFKQYGIQLKEEQDND